VNNQCFRAEFKFQELSRVEKKMEDEQRECPKCGTVLEEGEPECPSCGESFIDEDEVL